MLSQRGKGNNGLRIRSPYPFSGCGTFVEKVRQQQKTRKMKITMGMGLAMMRLLEKEHV